MNIFLYSRTQGALWGDGLKVAWRCCIVGDYFGVGVMLVVALHHHALNQTNSVSNHQSFNDWSLNCYGAEDFSLDMSLSADVVYIARGSGSCRLMGITSIKTHIP